MTRLSLGFSSCPNDTFMFEALVHGRVGGGAEFDVVIADIEALNRRAAGVRVDVEPRLDVTKLSIAAWARVQNDYALLRAGAALGRGCGPLVLAPPGDGPAPDLAALAGKTIAVPGLQTTAFALLQMFGPADITPLAMRFDEVMPAVERGECDAGLVIHESRFTFSDHGLRLVADLGTLWEQDTGCPLPLGVIAIRRDLGPATAAVVEAGLRASVEHAWAHPEHSADYVRRHAQEIDPDVCAQHIALYVNAHSAELGKEGTAAIERFVQRAHAKGLVPVPVGESTWATSASP